MSRADQMNVWASGRLFARNIPEALRASTSAKKRIAVVLVISGWIPIFILSAIQGLDTLKAFVLDFAAQTRILLVIPLLLLMEQPLLGRYEAIARQFQVTGLLRDEDVPRAEHLFVRFVSRRTSLIAQFTIVLLIILFSVLLSKFVPRNNFPPWCLNSQAVDDFSPAGYWYRLVSMPILGYLVLRWLWDMLLWGNYLRSISRMDLRVVASHPDLMGGLSFLDTTIRGYLPLAFSIGTILAGGAATQILHHNQSLSTYKHVALFVVAAVVVICVAPLCTFFGLLNQARRRGTFEYGALAIRLGHEFENKWLRSDRTTDPSDLQVTDFSATTDLFAIAANVRQMNLVPVSLRSVIRLIVITAVPAIPVVLATLPFDVLMEKISKLMF
jgi:hypothetical protein